MDQTLPFKMTAARGPDIFDSRSCNSSNGTSSYPSFRSLSARFPLLKAAVSFLSRSPRRRFASRLGTRCCEAVSPRPRLRGALPTDFILLMSLFSPPLLVSCVRRPQSQPVPWTPSRTDGLGRKLFFPIDMRRNCPGDFR